MKVVSHGNREPQSAWSKRVECAGDGDGCGAVLEVGLADIYEVYRPQIDDDHYGKDIRQCVCCPDCGAETAVAGDRWLIATSRTGVRPRAEDREALAEAYRAQRGGPRM